MFQSFCFISFGHVPVFDPNWFAVCEAKALTVAAKDKEAILLKASCSSCQVEPFKEILRYLRYLIPHDGSMGRFRYIYAHFG